MFPSHYYADRFFNPRYWPKVGADTATSASGEIALAVRRTQIAAAEFRPRVAAANHRTRIARANLR